MAFDKNKRRKRIKYRIRKKVSGTSQIPRFSVFRSNIHIYAQLIDDIAGKTLISASSRIKELTEKTDISKIQKASEVGKIISKKAIEANIKNVVFDRNGYLFHGRVKALAEAAREGGLIF